VSDARWGSQAPFALGVEEELLLVDPTTHALRPHAEELLGRLDGRAPGQVKLDVYAALLELAAPPAPAAGPAVAALGALRAAAREQGATLLGAGVHPTGAFGDAPHVHGERYADIGRQLRGLARRTPTCAVHVHVSVPDAATAIRVHDGLREHLPLLQALAANSPFWHGLDSGLASARAAHFRAYPRAEIPPAFGDEAAWLQYADALVTAADVADYTFFWWDLRPHPRHGTVEVRAMDAQSASWSVAALAALVQGLAAAIAQAPPVRAPTPSHVLDESSFRALRDGLDATVLRDGALRPVRELAAEALALARPHARELGSEEALAGIERILAEGGGAERQRAAHARGGLPAVLAQLVAETAAPA
jgi:carboxylate-amine ligase